ncbi:MAG: hypothetical protein DYG98_22730 [Haliscomenobacteraceae bacterium CHB4]|nr:hypothetical protein [Haliscomenobacteraceae bacterium CHB4]
MAIANDAFSMKHLSVCSVAMLLIFACCKSKPKLSPEETVQIWQSYIDKNQFDLARELSAGEALDYVNELAGYNIGADTLAWENNVLLNLKCRIMGDSAICTYNFEDELGEPVPGQLALRRFDGYWFVSRTNFDDLIPVDSLRPGEEELLFPTDSLDEELE